MGGEILELEYSVFLKPSRQRVMLGRTFSTLDESAGELPADDHPLAGPFRQLRDERELHFGRILQAEVTDEVLNRYFALMTALRQ